MHNLARAMLMKSIDVAGYVRNMMRTERERLFFQLGVSLSHYEEALAKGDMTRARAHAEAAANTLDKIKATEPSAKVGFDSPGPSGGGQVFNETQRKAWGSCR